MEKPGSNGTKDQLLPDSKKANAAVAENRKADDAEILKSHAFKKSELQKERGFQKEEFQKEEFQKEEFQKEEFQDDEEFQKDGELKKGALKSVVQTKGTAQSETTRSADPFLKSMDAIYSKLEASEPQKADSPQGRQPQKPILRKGKRALAEHTAKRSAHSAGSSLLQSRKHLQF